MKGLASACRTVQKRRKPHLKLAKGAELMVSEGRWRKLRSRGRSPTARRPDKLRDFTVYGWPSGRMALDCMLMLKSLAQEAHAAAVEAKSSTITEEHIAAVWKTVKKKTHG
ncbi:centromere protein W isoform X1 [Petromyzon marinus]|uniref:Centromere protein W isoform X1 n=1 Tax=Petromyzon marinus TaxID=7757 RepID=A0AAJ7WZ43_PETMA|nr:centromere protein W isoform X1 [Petromyzon marinus]